MEMEVGALSSRVPNWIAVNKFMSDSLRQQRLSGPATVSNLTLDQHRISLSMAGFTIMTATAVELMDGVRRVCVMDAAHRYQQEESLQICQVVGKIVSNCFCDDSGVHIQMECGLALRCRRDRDFDNGSVRFPHGEGGERTFSF